MGEVELQRRPLSASHVWFTEFIVLELHLVRGPAETVTEQQPQQAARQYAALAIRFEMKAVGPRALLGRQQMHQAQVTWARSRLARQT